MRISVGLVLMSGFVSACNQGSITFILDLPPSALSPLSDTRASTISIIDDLTATQLGPSVSVRDMGSLPLGPIHIGNYDIHMEVDGGGQLLGLARTRSVTVTSGVDQSVTLHLRKPFAFFGSLPIFGSAPASVLSIDSTLPPGSVEPDLGNIHIADSVQASASTNDGRFVLLGAKDQLYVIDTYDLSLFGQVMITGGNIRQIVVSPDDQSAAILTDTMLTVITDLTSFDESGPSASTPIAVALPNPKAAAFSPDGQTLLVLSSTGSWEQIAELASTSWGVCTSAMPLPSSSLITLSVAALPSTTAPVDLPLGVVDVGWIANRPVIAVPCGAGVLFADDLSDLNKLPIAVAGHGIIRVASTPDRAAVITGHIANISVPVDPEQPRETNPMLPFGQLSIVDSSGGVVTSNFPLPTNQLDFDGADGSVVQTRVSPTRVDAYDLALSPDGAHVVMTGRFRYELKSFVYVLPVPDPNDPDITVYCDVDLTEDVYHVLEIDSTTGTVAYESVKGVNDTSCSTGCYKCTAAPNCAMCCQLIDPTRQTCLFSTGYAPGGLSVMMGGG